MRVSNAFFRVIDNFLNNTTMYRLVLYYLLVVLGWASVLSLFGLLSFNIFALLFSTLVMLAVGWVTNKIFAYIFKVPGNLESIYISILILSLIISPIRDLHALPFIFWAAVWTAASKYIFAIKKKHIFNPAAVGVIVTGIGIAGSASWWVGTAYMVPVVLAGGLLVIRKIRRWDLFLSFLVVAIGAIFLSSFGRGSLSFTLFAKIFLDSPILFFAFVMLTEPLTTPPGKMYRMIYASLVGFLFSPQLHLGNLYTTPEMALVIGNIFSYVVSPKEKLVLKLKEKIQQAPNIYDFVFGLEHKQTYLPGQYMEWTMGYKNPDSRGNRRYFTVASSPTEDDLRIGVRFNDPSSSYKLALLRMEPGDKIVASSLSGEFVLPKNQNEKLVFIAGGVGITPFRSMIRFLLDSQQKRPITLIYSNRKQEDIVYKDVFERASRELGLKTIYTLTDPGVQTGWTGRVGALDRKMIEDEVPEWKNSFFYISGPHAMVSAFEGILKQMGIPGNKIKIDYFPGFA